MNTAGEEKDSIANWMAYGERGISSETMALWLGFGRGMNMHYHPVDPADFDRCLRLLEFVPSLRAKLPKMAELSPQWAALVARWDEIEASHLAEVGLGWTKANRAERTYELMQSVLEASR